MCSQRRHITDVEIYGKNAERFLSLRPSFSTKNVNCIDKCVSLLERWQFQFDFPSWTSFTMSIPNWKIELLFSSIIWSVHIEMSWNFQNSIHHVFFTIIEFFLFVLVTKIHNQNPVELLFNRMAKHQQNLNDTNIRLVLILRFFFSLFFVFVFSLETFWFSGRTFQYRSLSRRLSMLDGALRWWKSFTRYDR